MTIAHIAGVPVEEALPSLVGAGSAFLLALTWAMARILRPRRPPGS
jgi:hypothetical protein